MSGGLAFEICGTLTFAFFPASYFHTTMVQGNVMRMQVCTLLYKKILRLNSQGASKTSVGKLINLMSNDASRYEYFLIFFPQGLFMPVAVGTTMWYLHTKIGAAIFATLGITALVCCISQGFARHSFLVSQEDRIIKSDLYVN